jgi:hypothetical protein
LLFIAGKNNLYELNATIRHWIPQILRPIVAKNQPGIVFIIMQKRKINLPNKTCMPQIKLSIGL